MDSLDWQDELLEDGICPTCGLEECDGAQGESCTNGPPDKGDAWTGGFAKNH